MTDTIRDLLISLASHIAYMQGQLEARHELDDFEDFYWYRESVLLRQKVTDALAEKPAVPDGREPASVTGQPSDEDLWNTADLVFQANSWPKDAIRYARAVLARWGNPAPQPPAEGEVAELVEGLRLISDGMSAMGHDSDSWFVARAADLLHRLSPPQPVPVSERLPAMVTDGLRVAGDCDEQGRCWAGTRAFVDTSGDRDIDYPPSWELREVRAQDDVWLPAHALPLPGQEVE